MEFCHRRAAAEAMLTKISSHIYGTWRSCWVEERTAWGMYVDFQLLHV